MNKSTEIYFHYFLPENSHAMNALVRNRCEYRFLEMLNELCYSYGIFYEIDSEVKEEGGIVDWWNVFSTNATAIQTVCAVLTLFITGAVSLKTLLPDEEKNSAWSC